MVARGSSPWQIKSAGQTHNRTIPEPPFHADPAAPDGRTLVPDVQRGQDGRADDPRRAQARASRTCRTEDTVNPGGGFASPARYTVRAPAAAAAASRRSIPATGRTIPVRPTSPTKATPWGAEVCVAAE